MIWTDKDYSEMSWHDNIIHSISFPKVDLDLRICLDYILEWKLNSDTNKYQFVVAPAIIEFYNVLHLSILLSFGEYTGLYIDEIIRKNERISSNGKYCIYDYVIVTDRGKIKFNSTGFQQKLTDEPRNTNSQIYLS
jgi:hypothetical protein